MNDLKHQLRMHWKKLRAEISPSRRKEAEGRLIQYIFERLNPTSPILILSYASFNHELSTKHLNCQLLKAGHILALPQVDLITNSLKAYQVYDLDNDLTPHAHGFLEPKPQCAKINIQHISLVLVPALAFDQAQHRLGYGKGYYDRFLKQLPPETKTLGVGFLEQYSKEQLPISHFDHSLNEILLM